MRVLVLGAGVVGVTAAWYLAARRPRGDASSTASPGRRSRRRSPTAARSRRRTPSRGPNPDAPAKILQWLGRRTRRCSSGCAPMRGSGAGACSSCSSACRRARGATRSSASNLALYSRDCLQRAARGDRHRVRPARARHPRVLHRREGVRRTASPRPTLMRRVRLRPRREDRRRMRRDRAGARRVPRSARRRHLHGERRIGRRAALHAGARAARRRARRRLPLEHDGRGARGRRRRGRAACAASTSTAAREMLAADAYVVALGSYSPLLLRPLGVPCLVYPRRATRRRSPSASIAARRRCR